MNRASAVLAGMSLLILGGLGFGLLFVAVPQENRELIAAIVGAISGGLVTAGGMKLADRITAPDATVNADGGAGR